MRRNNCSRNNLWGKSEKTDLHYKMYKVGKKWVFASLFMLSLGSFMLSGVSVHADTQAELAKSEATTSTTLVKSAANDTSAAANSQGTSTAATSEAGSTANSSNDTTSTSADKTSTTATTNASSTSSSDAVKATSTASAAVSQASQAVASDSTATSNAQQSSTSAQPSDASAASSKAATSAESGATNSGTSTANAKSDASKAASETSGASNAASGTSQAASLSKSDQAKATDTLNSLLKQDNINVNGSTIDASKLTSDQLTALKAALAASGQKLTVNETDAQKAADAAAAKATDSLNDLLKQDNITVNNSTIDVTKLTTAQLTALKTAIASSGQKITLNETDAQKAADAAAEKAASADAISNAFNELVKEGKITNGSTINVAGLSTDQLSTLQSAIAKAGVSLSLSTTSAVDTSSASYAFGLQNGDKQLDSIFNFTLGTSSPVDIATNITLIPKMAAILEAFISTNGTMLNADGSLAWPSGYTEPCTDGQTIYHHYIGNYWDANSGLSDKNGTFNTTDYNAGFAAILKTYCEEINSYLNQVKNNVNDPTYADALVNDKNAAYDPTDLHNTTNGWGDLAALIKAGGALFNNPVNDNNDIFSKTATTPTDANATLTTSYNKDITQDAQTSIDVINTFIGIAITNIQNGIMKQALSDIRSLGGNQGNSQAGSTGNVNGSIAIPGTLTEALELNASLNSLINTFGFGKTVDSSVINGVYLDIAYGIRNAISLHFQKGVNEAIDHVLNGKPAPDFSSVAGYTANSSNPEAIANTAQAAGSDTLFVEAIGYAWASKIAQPIVNEAVNDIASDTVKSTATEIVNALPAGTLSDTEMSELLTEGAFDKNLDSSDTTNPHYTPSAKGALQTILDLYNAEVNALKQAQADYIANPDATPDANNGPKFANEGTSGIVTYDATTGKYNAPMAATSISAAGDYVRAIEFLQSTHATGYGQADADDISHTQHNGDVATITSTTKTFTGDETKLDSVQLAAYKDKIAAFLLGTGSNAAQQAYIKAYNDEAGLANAAFEAGGNAAYDQTNSTYFMTNGTIPVITVGNNTVTIKVADVTYSASDDGTASNYSATSGLGGQPTGTAFVDGYVASTIAAIQAAIKAIANDTKKHANSAAADATNASNAALSADAYASQAESESALFPSDAAAASDAKIASDAAVDADTNYKNAKSDASDASDQAKTASDQADDSATSDAKAALSAQSKATSDAGSVKDDLTKINTNRDTASDASGRVTTDIINDEKNAAADAATSAANAASAASEANAAAQSAEASAASDEAIAANDAKSDSNAVVAGDAKAASDAATSAAAAAASAEAAYNKANAAASDAAKASSFAASATTLDDAKSGADAAISANTIASDAADDATDQKNAAVTDAATAHDA
ncbi:KxYKxGKxW signal peptide domain-containing protein, partial [Lentilactobacillus rapi]